MIIWCGVTISTFQEPSLMNQTSVKLSIMSSGKIEEIMTQKNKGRAAKNKGKVGEREVANILKEKGFVARRGQQFSGEGDSPDVVWDVPWAHIEVKRTEKCSPYAFLEQAKEDAKGKNPVVFHRQNKREWIAILPMDDYLELVKFKKDKEREEFDSIEF